MATTFGQVDFMNRRQLRAIARTLRLAHDNSTTNAALVTAIKAA